MICPRCDSDSVKLLTKSSVGDAWEIYMCDVCNYSYRNTEPEENRNPDLFDKRFKIKPEDINKLGVIPPIPDLFKK